MNVARIKDFSLLIVDDLHLVFLEMLDASGIRCDYRPEISRAEALSIVGDYQGLILRSKFKVDQEMLAAGKNLKLIGRAGAGIDNIDQVCALQKQIVLLSANEGNCDAVGEHMLGMLLALFHQIAKADRQIRDGLWLREENRGVELGGKVIGLIGYGHNGKAFARKLSGFDVKVLAYDKYKSGYSDSYAQEADMDEIFRRADVLSLHIPLTEETRHLVDRSFLSRFEKAIYLLNGSRGEILDVYSLIEGLERRRILGAGLDVLIKEKFPELAECDWFERLKGFDNVLLTPHVAGWSVESYYKLSKILAEKILALRQV